MTPEPAPQRRASSPPFVKPISALALEARSLRHPTLRDAGIYLWVLAPIVAVFAGRFESRVYLWLVPLAFLALAIAVEQLTRHGFRDSTLESCDGGARPPRYFAAPWSIATAGALGVLASLRLVQGDFDGRGVWTANFMMVAACSTGLPLLMVARHCALNWPTSRRVSGFREAFVLRSAMLLVVFGIAQAPRSCAHRREVWASVDDAMAACSDFVPRLAAWRNAHGEYPASLSELGEDASLPQLLHGKARYSAKDDRFNFDVPDPTEFLFPEGWEYYSDTRRWHHYN